MDLPGIILHLKANAPCFCGRVAGAAEYTSSMAGELRPEAYPAAYVVPLGEQATVNDETNALYQMVNEHFAVVVEFDNTSDRRGQSVTELYQPTRKAILRALLNWRGTDPEHALRGIELEAADMLQQDRARIFYQWAFVIQSTVTDEDGWQEYAPPLLEIDANTDPTDPQPGFRVQLPQE